MQETLSGECPRVGAGQLASESVASWHSHVPLHMHTASMRPLQEPRLTHIHMVLTNTFWTTSQSTINQSIPFLKSSPEPPARCREGQQWHLECLPELKSHCVWLAPQHLTQGSPYIAPCTGCNQSHCIAIRHYHIPADWQQLNTRS